MSKEEKSIDDGGLAFPQPIETFRLETPNLDGNRYITAEEVEHGGMTLRDYIAAQVIGHIVARGPEEVNMNENDCAAMAYSYANAMLRARKAGA